MKPFLYTGVLYWTANAVILIMLYDRVEWLSDLLQAVVPPAIFVSLAFSFRRRRSPYLLLLMLSGVWICGPTLMPLGDVFSEGSTIIGRMLIGLASTVIFPITCLIGAVHNGSAEGLVLVTVVAGVLQVMWTRRLKAA
jgi:hypothetical protein